MDAPASFLKGVLGMIKTKKIGLHTFMAVPAFLLFALFFIYPLIQGIGMSLTDWDGLGRSNFIGLQNFFDFFKDERAITDIKNTLLFALGSAPLLNIIGLIYALLMNGKFKGKGIARVIIYLPAVISPLIMGYIWYLLLQPERGFVFHALELIGKSSWLGGLYRTHGRFSTGKCLAICRYDDGYLSGWIAKYPRGAV